MGLARGFTYCQSNQKHRRRTRPGSQKDDDILLRLERLHQTTRGVKNTRGEMVDKQSGG